MSVFDIEEEKQRIEDLEEEFRDTLRIYLPKLFCFIDEEIRNCNKNGNNIAFVQLAEFYLHNNLHKVFSKFNELFIHLEDKNDFWEPLGIKYIKNGVEDDLNIHFYIPILINILSGFNGQHEIFNKFALDKPLLEGFGKISFSSTGYLPDFQHYTPYYVVKFDSSHDNDYFDPLGIKYIKSDVEND